MVFFSNRQNRKLQLSTRKSFAFGLILVFGCVLAIFESYNFINNKSTSRKKRSNDVTCLDKFESVNNGTLTSNATLSCKNQLVNTYDNWENLETGKYGSGCVYWCDASDYSVVLRKNSLFKLHLMAELLLMLRELHAELCLDPL